MDSIRGTYLSNFWECAVEYEGFVYRNSEAAFQAQKCLNFLDKRLFTELNGAQAKALGKKIAIHDNWDMYRLVAMYTVVKAKFTQNPELARKLIATGDEEIVEGNTWGDRYWGVCNGVGRNMLGNILMDVRLELANEQIYE